MHILKQQYFNVKGSCSGERGVLAILRTIGTLVFEVLRRILCIELHKVSVSVIYGLFNVFIRLLTVCRAGCELFWLLFKSKNSPCLIFKYDRFVLFCLVVMCGVCLW